MGKQDYVRMLTSSIDLIQRIRMDLLDLENQLSYVKEEIKLNKLKR